MSYPRALRRTAPANRGTVVRVIARQQGGRRHEESQKSFFLRDKKNGGLSPPVTRREDEIYKASTFSRFRSLTTSEFLKETAPV